MAKKIVDKLRKSGVNMPKAKIIAFTLIGGLLALVVVFNYFVTNTNHSEVPLKQPNSQSGSQSGVTRERSAQGKSSDNKQPNNSVEGIEAERNRQESPTKAPPEKTGAGNQEPKVNRNAEQNVTVSDIEKKYRPQFLALKAEYNARLNNLAARALNEYLSYKQNNQNPPVLSLVKKYLKAGSALEAECDRRFNALLARMEQDLIDAGLPLDLVDKAKREYESQKIQRKKQLIQSGLKFAGI